MESQKVLEVQRSNQSLMDRIEELKVYNQRNENIAAEKQRQIEFDL